MKVSSEEAKMNYTMVNKDELPRDGNTSEFEGYQYGETHLSFLWVDLPPGGGPRLHSHPYEEVFLVQEGQATFTVGSTVLEVKAGHILIVPAGVPHTFLNSGEGRLGQIDIHRSPQFITQWLED
jgi:mannose-6-phosphate isomerase-like protein (cupin superfamily)